LDVSIGNATVIIKSSAICKRAVYIRHNSIIIYMERDF
jgi:hypothetical protein